MATQQDPASNKTKNKQNMALNTAMKINPNHWSLELWDKAASVPGSEWAQYSTAEWVRKEGVTHYDSHLWLSMPPSIKSQLCRSLN